MASGAHRVLKAALGEQRAQAIVRASVGGRQVGGAQIAPSRTRRQPLALLDLLTWQRGFISAKVAACHADTRRERGERAIAAITTRRSRSLWRPGHRRRRLVAASPDRGGCGRVEAREQGLEESARIDEQREEHSPAFEQLRRRRCVRGSQVAAQVALHLIDGGVVHRPQPRVCAAVERELRVVDQKRGPAVSCRRQRHAAVGRVHDGGHAALLQQHRVRTIRCTRALLGG